MTLAVYPIWHPALLGAYAGFLFHCYSRPVEAEALGIECDRPTTAGGSDCRPIGMAAWLVRRDHDQHIYRIYALYQHRCKKSTLWTTACGGPVSDGHDLAARLEVPVAAIMGMAEVASFRIIDRPGGRWLRLRDAGAIVRTVDPVSPRWDRRPRG